MYDVHTLESQARHQIRERVSRASEPHLRSATRRHLLASRLRRFADRLDD